MTEIIISSANSTKCPGFIESFGFHLAVHLLGDKSVSKAMQDDSDQSILLWRSPLRDVDLINSNANDASSDGNDQTNAHIFFIDASFEFITCSGGNERTLHTKFGALIKVPIEKNATTNMSSDGAVYLQSSPWTISNLETYAIGTGICVEETGPAGMAETVALSLKKLHEPRLKQLHVDNSSDFHDARVNAYVDIFHLDLLERVTLIHATQTFSEGHIGGAAFSMLMACLTHHATRKEHDLESSSADLVDTFNAWWAFPREKLRVVAESKQTINDESIETYTNAELDNAPLANTLSAAGTVSNRGNSNSMNVKSPNVKSKANESTSSDTRKRVHNPNTKRKADEIIPEAASTATTCTTEMEIKSVSRNDNTAPEALKQSVRRPKIVHGATRKKKRKKGKMTFAKA